MCGNIVKITETVKPYKVIYEHPTYHKKPNRICDHPDPKECDAHFQSCTRPKPDCEYRNPLKLTKYWLGRAQEVHDNRSWGADTSEFNFILHALNGIVEALANFECRGPVQNSEG